VRAREPHRVRLLGYVELAGEFEHAAARLEHTAGRGRRVHAQGDDDRPARATAGDEGRRVGRQPLDALQGVVRSQRQRAQRAREELAVCEDKQELRLVEHGELRRVRERERPDGLAGRGGHVHAVGGAARDPPSAVCGRRSAMPVLREGGARRAEGRDTLDAVRYEEA
jgi:hypothetical protein